MKRLHSLQLQKFPQLKHVSISPKSSRCSVVEITTQKLVNCTIGTFTKNNKLSNIKTLSIKKQKTITAPTMEQTFKIIDDIFEFDPKQLKQIFNKFVENVDINIDQLECCNLVRKQIQLARICQHRLDELLLQTTALSNTINILCSTQISMIQALIE
ncbi:Hypothetical_protein [Hexamita inflata]|uniref:Hypothetical_protein n=1 Tax=Hexamita inflata TaxID=28002 RepID=A0AA86U5A3_9EUKA|nr:Hypothetical protein HINF_LOCUS29099 [Hexamita inflata]